MINIKMSFSFQHFFYNKHSRNVKLWSLIKNRIYMFLSLLHLKISTIVITYSQNILRLKNIVCVENFFTGALSILLQSNRVLDFGCFFRFWRKIWFLSFSQPSCTRTFYFHWIAYTTFEYILGMNLKSKVIIGMIHNVK